MAVIQPKFLTPVVAQFEASPTLLQLLNNSIASTPVIDRSLTPTFAEYVKVSFKHEWSVVPTGNVHIRVFGWHSNETDNTLGPNEDIHDGNIFHGVLIKTITPSDYYIQYGDTYVLTLTFNIAEYFGGIIPPRFRVVIENTSNFLIEHISGEQRDWWCTVTGVQAESI